MTDDQWMTTLWLAATRYYIGRTTYAVADFCVGLIREWPQLPQSTRDLIQRGIEAAFDADDRDRKMGLGMNRLGMDTDRRAWETVRALWKGGA